MLATRRAVRQVLHGQVVEAQLAEVRAHQDLALGAADHLGLADAVDLLQGRLDHLARELGHARHGVVALQHQDGDGAGAGIPAQDQRPVGGLGEVVPVGDPVDGLAQVQVGEVHLRAPLVLHGDGGDALAGLGDHAAHAGQAGDDLLQGLGHQAGQVVGRGVGVVGDHRQVGVVDGRQQVHRQALPGLQADQHQAREQHQDGHGPPDGGLDDHRPLSAPAAAKAQRSTPGTVLRTLILASWARVRWSLTTTSLAGRQAAAAVHRLDLDPLVVLQAGVHVQPLGPVVLALEHQGPVVADQHRRLGHQQPVREDEAGDLGPHEHARPVAAVGVGEADQHLAGAAWPRPGRG